MLGFAGHEHLFVGQDALAIERHWRILNNIQFHWGRPWPLDLALWDLAGKITGQPVWRLLGGLTATRSGPMRRRARCGPAELADAAERYLALGFPALKIRFHRGDWRDDIAALEAVRARVGDRLELMVDCNQGWRMSWDAYPSWTLKDALPGRARARAARRLLDGGAAASRRPRGHAAPARRASTCASPAAR